MELYIGGAFQGKLEYVKSLYNSRNPQIYGRNDFEKLLSLENQDAIWNDFHLTIKNLLENPSSLQEKDSSSLREKDSSSLRADAKQSHQEMQTDFDDLQNKISNQVFSIIEKNPEIKIISCEIGSGIVPIEKSDRIWRDFSGHLLVQIAKKAEKVVRIICGLPQRIK